MTTALVFYEDVLMASRDRPVLEGFHLAHSLSSVYRLVVATSGSEARVDHQLRTERLQDAVAEVLSEKDALAPLPLWQRQIEVARSRYPVALLVAADPAIVEWAFENRIMSLLFVHPKLGSHERIPGVGNRKWESLVGELEARL